MLEAGRRTAAGSSAPITKRPRNAGAFLLGSRTLAYFSDELIEVNLLFRLAPRPFTIAMIASEMPAAISPYSIAVAPDSSFTKRAIRFFIDGSMCTRGFELQVVLPAFSAP